MSKARELASLGNAYSDGALSNRNLIINGAMAIDQRNAGAAITGSSSTGFPVDRFALLADTTGTVTAQQVSDAPAGFVKSAKVTCTTAATSDTSSSRVQFVQAVEGYNTASLGFGGANAKYITVSFWVKASNAGTYGGSIVNNGGTRSYPYSYTISAPNVWEYKTVTVAGDTIGAWEKDNLVGLFVFWILGAGSNFVGTADQWQNSFKPTPASTFSLKDTLNATWQITGVQLEVGDTATPFEHRSYGQELALCQRYFQFNGSEQGRSSPAGDRAAFPLHFSPEMRAVPTLTLVNSTNAIDDMYTSQRSVTGMTGTYGRATTQGIGVEFSCSTTGNKGHSLFSKTLSFDAEL